MKRRRRAPNRFERAIMIDNCDGLELHKIKDHAKVSRYDTQMSGYDKDSYYVETESGFKVLSVQGKVSKVNRSRNLRLNLEKEKVRGGN